MKIIEITAQISPLTFRIEQVDYRSGQSDRILACYRGGVLVGQIEYSDYAGEPHVKMIHVLPQYRRQGIGTALVRRLQSEYPGIEINMGMLTSDGGHLLKSIPHKVFDDPEYMEVSTRLEQLRAEDRRYQEIADRYYANPSPADRQAVLALTDWNDIHDEIYNLEKRLQGLRNSTRIYEVA